ncbi:PepSY-associated TM helix domain-containing protein [uncultured Sphingomonas sp.]|uniref:PepSY-associated TM helix domain-containing protein n=1 Tax=uncultured Sphingomonas sp. TaxID=158754 RepID=UPI0035CA4177
MNKQAWRRTWFSVHKWIGLLLAALIIPVSFSGAVLVWHEEIEHAIHPERFAVTAGPAIGADAYLQAARGAIGAGDRVSSLAMPRDGEAAVVSATAAPGKGGPPVRTSVYLDPPTARVMAVARSDEGLLRVLHILHGSLYVPGVGRQIVGWIGVAMMLSAFTGLWLWWPAMGRWTRGLRWRRHPNVETNLHHQMGFWIALPLFVLSLTGAWISFPAFFGKLSGEARPAGGGGRPVPVATPKSAVADVLAAGGGAAVTNIAWPTDRKPAWTLRTADGQLSVDDATRVVTHEPAPATGIARLMRQVHDGTGMNIVWRVAIFLGGLIPVVLAVTGVIMWWRARVRRANTTRRPRVRAVV